MIIHTRKKKYLNKAKKKAATDNHYQRIFDSLEPKSKKKQIKNK